MSEKIINTDVLVIGGGMAGCFAAIKARSQGLDVTLTDKGYVGKSGATHYADGNLMYFRPERGHKLNDWINLICERGEYLNNRDWVQICLEESKERFEDMESWNIPFYRPEGKLFINKPDSTWVGIDDITGGNDKDGVYENIDLLYRKHAPVFRKKALEVGVNILDRIMFSELLKQDGEIAGAIGFHTTTGDLYIFITKAVVIATGGGGFKAECNWTNYWTGDGEAMAYRAGAEIASQEFSRYGTDAPLRANIKPQLQGKQNKSISGNIVDSVYEKPFAGGMVTGWLRANLNAEGNPVTVAAWDVHSGKAPLYTDLDSWTPQQMKWMRYYIDTRGATSEERVGFNIFDKGKVQYPASRIWASPTAAGAGIWPISKQCATGIPGLFACGDCCATMASGASYAGMGFGLNHAAVTGSRAGLGAAEYASKARKAVINKDDLTKIKTDVCAPLERTGGFTPGWVNQIIQSLTIPYFYLGIKKEDRLQAAITLIEFVNNHLTPKLMAKDAHGWRMAQEAINMAHIAEMRLRASLFRTESRGTHFREDFPRRQDPEWLAWVKVKDYEGKMKVTKEPIPEKWWPDLSKSYEERYPHMFPGE